VGIDELPYLLDKSVGYSRRVAERDREGSKTEFAPE